MVINKQHYFEFKTKPYVTPLKRNVAKVNSFLLDCKVFFHCFSLFSNL